MPASRRFLAIAAGVLLLHAVALWALQGALRRTAPEVVVPVSLLAQGLTPAPQVPAPAPAAAARTPPAAPARSQPAAPPLNPPAVPTASPATPAFASPPAPATAPPGLAPAGGTPAAQASGGTGAAANRPEAGAPPAAASGTAAAQASRIELPSSDADYLQNPKPPYPALSRRLGEQGKVITRVFIGVNGLPQKAEIVQSSGYDRLDQSALQTVLKWRYVPGKRGGTPEAMWFNVPLDFVLE